ncbi:SAE2-domain-containing protein [Annulohypoxylon bovei var. microspora]|nr:SAE2-domain-containing protein [Annulohypoxylon bovei var. microspora]
MENWFKEVGRPALFDALAGVCDRIDNELDVELGSHISKNTRLSTELESLRSRVSDVDQLREENQFLQREIQKLKDVNRAETSSIDQTIHHDGTRNSRHPLAPKSVNQVSNPKRSLEPGKNIDNLKFSELKEEHLKLGGNHIKLREKYSELEDAHTKLNRRLRDMTKAYNRWMGHANQLNELCQKRSRTIKKLEAKLDATASETTVPFNASFSSDGSVQPERRQQTIASELVQSNASKEPGLARSDLIPREPPLIWPPTDDGGIGYESLRSTASASPKLAKIVDVPRMGQRRAVTPRSGRYMSTQNGEASLPPLSHDRDANSEGVLVKHEPSSDTPVVVSERCLRKRKHGDEQMEEPRALVKVKVEEDGSDPRIINEHHEFVPHESIDFDAEGGRVDTPRKRNRTNVELEDMSGLNSIGIPWSHADTTHINRRENLMQNALRQGRSSIPPRFDENPKSTHAKKNVASHPLELQKSYSSALQLFDRSTAPRQKLEVNTLTKRNEPSSLCNGIASLVEDGDEYETPRITTKKIPKTGRLRDLLDYPTPRHENITPTRGAQSNQAHTSAFLGSQVPQRRELPFGKSSVTPFEKRVKKTIGPPVTPEAPNSRRTSTNISTERSTSRRSDERAVNSVASDDTPLRDRPKSQLAINDFKVNPNTNEGYNFAFTDVVRNKDERANLAGCVQEGCCGQAFRLQARVQRDQTSTSDFQALLEKHLGDDAWKLSSMTRPEKEELWLEAKTQELANEHGKHRHRFHRAASPVGFWRTDFPNTQEEQRDKEEAAKVARQIVDERYREAMRPGGKWLFRDE